MLKLIEIKLMPPMIKMTIKMIRFLDSVSSEESVFSGINSPKPIVLHEASSEHGNNVHIVNKNVS